MGLQSELFRGDPKLEAAAVSNPAHILPGSLGPHVSKIQQALIQLDNATISDDEVATGSYGPSTADAVLAYKQKRDIVNRSYETQADNIVGIMTMASRNMVVALNRSFETAPLIAPTLFVANPIPSQEQKASAYTVSGGAFLSSKIRSELGIPANRIYLCNVLSTTTKTFQTMTVVHELAHYVSGSAIEITDPLNDFFFSPQEDSNLNAPTPRLNPKAVRLAPFLKVRDAEHYAAFAFLATRPRLA